MAPRGVPQIEVTFNINANGIVSVAAKDKATGKEQSVSITASSGLSDDEVDSLVKEAEESAAGDEERRHLAELRNSVDSMVYQIGKQMKDQSEQLSDDDTKPLTEALEVAKAALESGEKEALEAAKTGLEEAAHKLAEKVYNQQGTPGSDGPAPEDGSGDDDGGDDDVIDAEFDTK